MNARHHELVGQILLPGDRILSELPKTGKLKLGPGLRISPNNDVSATHTGVLSQAKSGKLWLRTSLKRYVPAMDEVVVGIIQDRNAEVFLVEINGHCLAELPVTSFENATKRNVPPLKSGDLVHGRITSAYAHANPTLSCIDSNGKAAGMGVLKNGYTVRISTAFARSLLSKPVHPALSLLAEKLPFEIVIGMNGIVWIDARNPTHSILITTTLQTCDGCERTVAETRVRQALANVT